MMEEQSECFFMRAMFNNPFSLLVVSLSRCVGVTFELPQVHFSFLTEFKHNTAKTQLHKEDRLFFVKGKLMAPLVTAGVSDGVAQELQMPTGPHALEDAGAPMPSRLATLEDPGTPDQIVLDLHSLTHFPSLPWCKVCVEFRGRDAPHREQSKRDAVVPQLPFECGYMETDAPYRLHVSSWEETPLLDPCLRQWCQTPRRWTCSSWFFVYTDTHSQAQLFIVLAFRHQQVKLLTATHQHEALAR